MIVEVYKLIAVFLIIPALVGTTSICSQREYGDSSFVCVCNKTVCDDVPEIGLITRQQFIMYSSSQSSDRFTKTINTITNSSVDDSQPLFRISRNVTYQSILGFGGAFTDAAGINILSLSDSMQDKLLSAYFGPDGIEYTTGRIPIGSTDFSTHSYSYDDVVGDLKLSRFSLTAEDTNLKIPLVKRAQSKSKSGLRLFSSSWSAPAWMKTSKSMVGRGYLIGQPGGPYYKAWANYLISFLDAYKKEGIEFWGMTAQNEPTDGDIPFFPFQCMGFTKESQRDFIAEDLGPALWSNGYKNLKLMILDDDMLNLPNWAKTVYSNTTAAQYVAGLAVHWYVNGLWSYDRLTETHDLNPSKFILATEACAGSGILEKKVMLGNWERAESYTHDILKDLQNWVVGWTDWNLALNTSGGPNWVNNNVDSPIIVNSTANEFLKQPMFYAMGHFSKFLRPGSVRLHLMISNTKLDGVAFLTPEKRVVLIVFNSGDTPETLQVLDAPQSFLVKIAARSVNTLLWNNN